MANASRKEVKMLIELCTDVEEADRIIEDYYGFKTIREKAAFLNGMFDIPINGHEHEEPNEDTYQMMLHTIISITKEKRAQIANEMNELLKGELIVKAEEISKIEFGCWTNYIASCGEYKVIYQPGSKESIKKIHI